jgi:hypothetical protein
MMLAFTQNQQDGASQYIMAQNQMATQGQRKLLEQQAAEIQAGTAKVLAAQDAMVESM